VCYGNKGLGIVQKRLNTEKDKRNKWKWLVPLLVLILLIVLFLRNCYQKKSVSDVALKGNDTPLKTVVDTSVICSDTLVDTLTHADSSVADTVIKVIDSTMIKKEKSSRRNPGIRKDIADTVKSDTALQGTSRQQDTLIDSLKNARLNSETVKPDSGSIEKRSPCEMDTSQLWVYPDPSGGLHRLPQKVRFYSNRQCKIFWRTKGSSDWIVYDGNEIVIGKTETMQFSGVDTCGKEMDVREEYFEIEREVKSVCQEGMAHVSVGEASFCVDIYEWPNKSNVRPTAYVSLYQASDSCFSIGKRLCTADEWLLACSGPYSTLYPYGNSYEERACATADTVINRSGEKVECRSYFGLYDMSGNLQEWTDTRASENGRFNYVTGGFWKSGIKSSCKERRYSYFSQNRHNPVGFRCCKDVESVGHGRKK
jgi:hypothetical protein